MVGNVVSHYLVSLGQIRIEAIFADVLKTKVRHLWVTCKVLVTLGMHQCEVHFFVGFSYKLFLIFTSKCQTLGVILLFILARPQSLRQIQVHEQSSHHCNIYTIASQCFCITVMGK